MGGVQAILGQIMNAGPGTNTDELIAKLRLALEPMKNQVLGGQGPPNMHGGPQDAMFRGGPPGMGPRPHGLLGNAPPGFNMMGGPPPGPPNFPPPGQCQRMLFYLMVYLQFGESFLITFHIFFLLNLRRKSF